MLCASPRRAFATVGFTVLARVRIVGEEFARLVASLAGVLECYIGIDAEGEPFLLAPYQHVKRHRLLPFGATSQVQLPPSNSLCGSFVGLTVRISCLGGSSGATVTGVPGVAPTCPRISMD